LPNDTESVSTSLNVHYGHPSIPLSSQLLLEESSESSIDEADIDDYRPKCKVEIPQGKFD